MIVYFLCNVEEREDTFTDRENETREKEHNCQPCRAYFNIFSPCLVGLFETKVEDERDEQARDTEAEETEQQVEDAKRIISTDFAIWFASKFLEA